jgi:hypothetical protein
MIATRRNDASQVILQARSGLAAIEEGGSPDFKPLLLLEWARFEIPGETRWQLLDECLQSAEQRSRFVDRLQCFRDGYNLLVVTGEEKLQKVAQYCQEKVKIMELEGLLLKN